MAILSDLEQPAAENQSQPLSGPRTGNGTGPDLEMPIQNNSAPGSSSQGDSEMRGEMDAMKAQMNEMMRLLLSLKNGNDFQTAQWPPYGLPLGYTPPANQEITQGVGPTTIVENAQPASVGSDGATGEPRVQTPPHNIVPQAVPQNFTPQQVGIPQVPGFTAVYPQVQHSAPIMAPTPQSHHLMGSYPQMYSTEHQKTQEMFRMFEERLRTIEGFGSGSRDAKDLCLIPDVVLPAKFKVPDFDKYRGLTCPKSHLIMYCRKMSTHSQDDKLLIHYFQESLTGASLQWYMKLEPSQIRCWKDLADAFLKQYQYNTDLAPDRTQLQGMSKRDNESFKEYAQRWRALAAQVTPPLLEKELAQMFLETLRTPYYEKLMSVASGFSEMVAVGERLENAIRSGRVAQEPTNVPNSQKKPFSGFSKKKEGETNAVTIGPPIQPPKIPVPTQKQPAHQPQTSNQNSYQKAYQNRTTFDPIPMSYTDLFNYLITNRLVSTRPMKPVQPPYFKTYNPNSTCAFHEGAVGHLVEDCKAFKILVQDMIDNKGLTFAQDDPNITSNPLPGHQKNATNAIMDMQGQSLRRSVEDIQTPLEVIHAELCKAKIIKTGCTQKEGCVDINCVGACESFKVVLQDLMDRCVIHIGFLGEDEVLALMSDESKEGAVPTKKGHWDTLGEPSGRFDYLVKYDAPESAQIRLDEIIPSGWDGEDEPTLQFSRSREVVVSTREENWDTLGQPSGKFDYLVRYDAPESVRIRIEEIQPSGWGEEDEEPTLHALGYNPSQADKTRKKDEKKEKRLARQQGKESNLLMAPICDIKESFKSAGMLDPNQVAAVEEEVAEEIEGPGLVRRSIAGEEIGNWKIVDLPVTFISE